jgi:hypothetical protein
MDLESSLRISGPVQATIKDSFLEMHLLQIGVELQMVRWELRMDGVCRVL